MREIAKIAQLTSRNEAHPETAALLASMRRAVDDLVNEPLADKPGPHHEDGYIVTKSDERGNNRDYTLRRLKRDRPDLAEMVIGGNLSANAAAIEAKFRRRDTPLDTLRRAWGKATEAR